MFGLPKPRPPHHARYVRLELEELEPRTVPAPLTPVQVRHAYGFDQIAFTLNGQTIAGDGRGQTIAIVNAYNHSRIAADLDTFDRTFSINGKQTLYQQYGPASSFLTVANPQGTPLADPTGGLWTLETALDVQWAHVVAPAAKIMLVQARTGSMLDLLAAVDYARKQPGVVAVSMSWGASEFSSERSYDRYFVTPAGHLGGSNGQGGPLLAGGVTFVAAAGDHGAPGLWPAMSPYVVAVGGTTLTVDTAGNYKGETAWTGSGGGVSKYEPKPSYQGQLPGTMRSIPDVAYNADPATGVYVYNSMPLNGRTGWWQVGGTSAGAPQWAGLIAIANQGRALLGYGSLDGATQTLPALYAMAASNFHDVTSGSNGFRATVGFDLATGRGSPIAPRVVADLLRANSQGTLTLSTTRNGTALIKPALSFTATVPADLALPQRFPTADVVSVLLREPSRTTYRPTPTSRPRAVPPHPLPVLDVRAVSSLFEMHTVLAAEEVPDALHADELPTVPDDTAERDACFLEMAG
jgi:hypothetical protein